MQLWFAEHGWRILGILIVTFIVLRVSKYLIEHAIRKVVVRGGFDEAAERQREDTLIHVCEGATYILIWLLALFTLLSELNVDLAPFIATAGIAGIALGFGGQYLVKDIITGLVMLIENQYRIGDYVSFDETTSGTVESITLRKTALRDLDGTLHHVPHGDIKRVANMTSDVARVKLDINIAYKSDIDQAIRVVNEVGGALAVDPEWMPFIRQAPAFVRVQDLADSSIVLRVGGEVVAPKKWDIQGELRKRLKNAFDAEGIEIPFNQIVVHQAEVPVTKQTAVARTARKPRLKAE